MNDDPNGRADAAPAQGARAPAPALPFRKDIEGLRAVAILLVVCAHAGVPWLAGGFVGVDVFFVLSGYLITALLVDELRRTGQIQLQAFYARRFQRLMPGLLMMIGCTTAAAMFVLAPVEQGEQASAAIAAATWTSNFRFAFQHLDYFGDAAESNLFLHTWSLGVEEQFYLLWPAIILLASRTSRLRSNSLDIRRLGRAFECIVLLAFVACVAATYIDQRFAFYMMPARSWQFAMGALVAISVGHLGAPRMRAVAGWGGLAAIVISALLLDSSTPYPGEWALLPSLGTVAILAAAHGASPGNREVGRLLGLRPFQAVGRLSYAWYLWHWPVLLLGRAFLEAPSPAQITCLVVLSFGLACISYYILEHPIRRSKALRRRPRVVLLAGICLMLAALPLGASWLQWADRYAREAGQLRYFEIRQSRPITYRMGCDDWFRSDRVQLCDFGPALAPHVVVLMGDSIAAQWLPAIRRIYNQPGWRILVITKSACPTVDEPFVYAYINREYRECTAWRKRATALVRVMRPDILLLSSHFGYPFTRKQWTDGATRFIASIRADNAKTRIGILRSTPQFPFDVPLCLARNSWRDTTRKPDACALHSLPPQEAVSTAALIAVTAIARQTAFVDMTAWICPAGHCLAEQGEMIAFRDNEHLSARFAASLAGPLAIRLNTLGLAPSAVPAKEPAGQADHPRTAP